MQWLGSRHYNFSTNETSQKTYPDPEYKNLFNINRIRTFLKKRYRSKWPEGVHPVFESVTKAC